MIVLLVGYLLFVISQIIESNPTGIDAPIKYGFKGAMR
jgi:hypothetical protein